jgi:ElaB/YqjD/DUF883 family membrane-anchored ribosome-binding protein
MELLGAMRVGSMTQHNKRSEQMAQIEKSNVAELNTDLSKQVAVLREDIANLTAIVADYSKAQGAQFKSAVESKAADVAATGATAARVAGVTAKVAYSDAEDKVRENPAAAVGIAAGLGFLVGLLTSRR